MKTKILTKKQIKYAANLIKKGKLVVFPTETVYGLGANAFDKKAVRKIFLAKGRPSDNPLIVHIADKKQLFDIAIVDKNNEKILEELTSKFWPGPLTIVLKKKKIIPDEVTAGLDSVAVRMPNNKIALDLIRYSKVPIAAPSANISGKPSPTTFEHVLEDMYGKVDAIIKARHSKIGLESTVIDLTSKKPLVLRPGGLSFEALKKVLPNLEIEKHKKTKKPKAPGMKYRHYSPNAKVILFEGKAKSMIKDYAKKLLSKGKKIVIVYPHKIKNFHNKLFKIFRDADKQKVDFILISSIVEKDLGLAVMNRIRKAAYKIIKRD